LYELIPKIDDDNDDDGDYISGIFLCIKLK